MFVPLSLLRLRRASFRVASGMLRRYEIEPAPWSCSMTRSCPSRCCRMRATSCATSSTEATSPSSSKGGRTSPGDGVGGSRDRLLRLRLRLDRLRSPRGSLLRDRPRGTDPCSSDATGASRAAICCGVSAGDAVVLPYVLFWPGVAGSTSGEEGTARPDMPENCRPRELPPLERRAGGVVPVPPFEPSTWKLFRLCVCPTRSVAVLSAKEVVAGPPSRSASAVRDARDAEPPASSSPSSSESDRSPTCFGSKGSLAAAGDSSALALIRESIRQNCGWVSACRGVPRRKQGYLKHVHD